MPPTSPEPVQTPFADKTCSWYQPLCQVTPVSKYLAAIIFIAAPFVGGYIGYTLAPERVVEVPVFVSTQTAPDNSRVTATSTTTASALNEHAATDSPVALQALVTTEATGDGIQIGESEIFIVITGSDKISLGKFSGLCRPESPTGFLEYRDELRKYILTSDQVVSHVYCAIPDNGREVVLYKPVGGAAHEYSVLTQEFRGGEGTPALPSDIKIIKTFVASTTKAN